MVPGIGDAVIPLIGATVAGLLAVLVALVTGGWVDALLALVVVVAVQQVDQAVLSPFVMSKAVELHPLVILLAIAAGGIIAGVVGAFLSAPVTAVVAVVIRELRYE